MQALNEDTEVNWELDDHEVEALKSCGSPPPVDTPELIRVVYTSIIGDSHDVSTIVVVSMKNNAQNGITGVLVYNEDTRQVRQVLEGPANTVLSLLDKIMVDPRHSDMLIERIEPIDQVSFPEWSMRAWVQPSQASRQNHMSMDHAMEVAFLDETFQHQARGVADNRPSCSSPCSIIEDNLIMIVYTSTLCHTCNVSDIVAAAMSKNKLNRISGVLVYDEKTRKVQQVLEGPSKPVLALLKKLQADSRHTDMAIERIEPIEQLCFPKWSMRAYVEGTDAGLVTRSTEVQEQILASRQHMETAFEDEDCKDKSSCATSPQACGATNRFDSVVFPTVPLLTIVYTSTLVNDCNIDDIITRAMEKNKLSGITGILVYNEQTRKVHQIVEGPADAVLELLPKIKADSRHYAMEIQRIEPIRQRCFPHWSMQSWVEGQIDDNRPHIESLVERLEGTAAELRNMVEEKVASQLSMDVGLQQEGKSSRAGTNEVHLQSDSQSRDPLAAAQPLSPRTPEPPQSPKSSVTAQRYRHRRQALGLPPSLTPAMEQAIQAVEPVSSAIEQTVGMDLHVDQRWVLMERLAYQCIAKPPTLAARRRKTAPCVLESSQS